MKEFSIVVLFHNNANFDYVIEALLKQRECNDEIIIVNDHSEKAFIDSIKPYSKLKNVRIVNSDLAGNRSRNRNIGAKFAKNENLLFVDGDIVLMDNCLSLIRMALLSGYSGAFGNIIHGGNTPEQMNLLVGFDYLDFLKGNPALEDFFKLNIAYDRRTNLIPENFIYRSEWQFYYSGYCAVTKKAFFECGRFNETFKGWGAEDVEFGYRLEKIGDIKFINGAYAYHLSHSRDLFSIMQNNKKNLYLFFSQQTCAETEIYLTFHLSTAIFDSMNYIKEKIKHLNLSSEHILKKKGEISILPVSAAYPDGNAAYIGEDGKIEKLSLMGLALPFNDNQFGWANISTDIFCYPESIAVRIVQECYRVAKNVKIYKSEKRQHIRWDSAPIETLLSRRSGMDRTNYHAHVINDFTFLDNGEYYTISGGVATKMPYVHIDNLPDVYPNKKAKPCECIIFDLTNGLTDAQIEDISHKNKLTVKGVYRLKLNTDQTKIRLSEIILGELQLLNTAFVYIVKPETVIDMTDIWWNYKTRQNDKIYQLYE